MTIQLNNNHSTKKILGGTLAAAVTALTATAPAEAFVLLGGKINNVYEYQGQSYDAQIIEGKFNDIFSSEFKDGLLKFKGSHNGAVGAAEALAGWAVNNNYNMPELYQNKDGGRDWDSPVTIWDYNSAHWAGKVGEDARKNGLDQSPHYYTGYISKNTVARFAVWSESVASAEPVPEPTTILASIAAGGMGLVAKRRQAKNKAKSDT